MPTLSVEDAQRQLSELIQRAAQGDEIRISRSDGTTVTLVLSSDQASPSPTFGSAEGKVWMRDDFDAPLDDFESYMPS